MSLLPMLQNCRDFSFCNNNSNKTRHLLGRPNNRRPVGPKAGGRKRPAGRQRGGRPKRPLPPPVLEYEEDYEEYYDEDDEVEEDDEDNLVEVRWLLTLRLSLSYYVGLEP